MNSNDLEALKEVLQYHTDAAKRLTDYGNDQGIKREHRKHFHGKAEIHARRAELLARIISEPGFTAVDMATATADGYADGLESRCGE